MIIKINPEDIPMNINSVEFCLKPYKNHPKGCPNYNKKKGCPPNISQLDKILNFDKDVYLIYTEFDIESHAKRMKINHPKWSERQIYCCLYWQPKARKFQRAEEEKCKNEKKANLILTTPEAMNVNVVALMKRIGIALEWPPRKTVRLVSLGGFRKT